MKLAIPLLNPNITTKDIGDNSGFVNAYFEDKNKPSLTDHLFLVYDTNAKCKDIATCFYKLNKFTNRYSTRIARINGKSYTVYCFTINRTIKMLRDGNIMLSLEQRKRILDFWDHKDPWITNNVLLGTMYEHPKPSVLPEEDYAPEEYGDEEGEAFS